MRIVCKMLGLVMIRTLLCQAICLDMAHAGKKSGRIPQEANPISNKDADMSVSEKIALIRDMRKPGLRRGFTMSDVRNIAMNKQEPSTVRLAAVREIAFRLQRENDMLAKRIMLSGLDAMDVLWEQEFEDNRKVLLQIVRDNEEDTDLKVIASKNLVGRPDMAGLLQKKLQILESAPTKDAHEREKSGLSSGIESDVLRYTSLLHSLDRKRKIIKCGLELLYARVKKYAEKHQGKMPGELSAIGGALMFNEKPFRYYPLKLLKQASPRIVLATAPEVLTLKSGSAVYVVDANKRITRMSRPDFLAKQGAKEAPELAPGMQSARPKLLVLMGDGSVKGLTKTNYRNWLNVNNRLRKTMGAPLVRANVFNKLLRVSRPDIRQSKRLAEKDEYW